MRTTLSRHVDDVSTDDLRRQLHVLRQDLGELTRLVRSAARGGARDARRAAMEEALDGRRKLEQVEEQLFEGVRARPGRSLLVALGAGALLALLLGRR